MRSFFRSRRCLIPEFDKVFLAHAPEGSVVQLCSNDALSISREFSANNQLVSWNEFWEVQICQRVFIDSGSEFDGNVGNAPVGMIEGIADDVVEELRGGEQLDVFFFDRCR